MGIAGKMCMGQVRKSVPVQNDGTHSEGYGSVPAPSLISPNFSQKSRMP